MTIRIDFTRIFPGILLLVIGVIVLIICGIAFSVWIFVRYDLDGVILLTLTGLVMVGSGLYLIFRGISFWSLIRMGDSW